jgi:predicted Zn finger-like uncharacterized protein
MNNSCPECGAVYAVAEKDIGRRIACKKCNTALEVTDNGLKRVDDFSPPNDDAHGRDRDDDRDNPRAARDDDDHGKRRGADDDDDDRDKKRDRDDDSGGRSSRKRGRDDDDEGARSSRSSRRERDGIKAGEMLKKLKGLADVSTWLYCIGLVLTIYAFFSPKIDQAKSIGRNGDTLAAEADEEDDVLDFSKLEKPDESDRKRRDAHQKDYQVEKQRLAIKEKYAKASAKKTEWWARIFGLIGFLLLTFGSLGYLQKQDSQMLRILGAVTILLILLQVILGGTFIGLQLGGPSPGG